MPLSTYASRSASPEDLSARILERKYVLTLIHTDRSGIAVDTGFVKIIVSLKFPPKILLSQCLTGLQSGMPLEVAAIRFLLLQTWHI